MSGKRHVFDSVRQPSVTYLNMITLQLCYKEVLHAVILIETLLNPRSEVMN